MSKLLDHHILTGIEVISTGEATIAILTVTFDDGVTRHWTGTAKRFSGQAGEKADAFDPEIGSKLALSRAFAAASKQLERQAVGKVKCADDNRKASAAAKLRTQKLKESGAFNAFRVKATERKPGWKLRQKTPVQAQNAPALAQK
jgi:hypothetical protein